jgi:23S rRNA (cytidine1920-2'-O)/16S rRNA (cytidine1409-2'-O)-methyltransferase
MGEHAEAVLLVKPQFEVGRNRLGKNGLVRRPGDRAEAVTTVAQALAASGLHVRDLAESPVTGSTGNHEYLLWTTTDEDVALTWEAVVRAADTLAANGAP